MEKLEIFLKEKDSWAKSGEIYTTCYKLEYNSLMLKIENIKLLVISQVT